MTENNKYRESYRNTPLSIMEEYLNAIRNATPKDYQQTNQKALIKAKKALKRLDYRDMLILQSSEKNWLTLMNDPDMYLRRIFCKNLYNLSESDLMDVLNIQSGTANNLFNLTSMPVMPRPFQLAILFNHPWQVVNKKNPDEFSYSAPTEYFFEGVAKRDHIKDLNNERFIVKSIDGYVITDPQEIFPLESSPITGRWVTTYREVDYFEFHLRHEPVMDKATQKKILNAFPFANDVIVTYTPFRPEIRSLWVMIPKNERMDEYLGILHELAEYRDKTVHHKL
ncbi:hypothetical protein [Paenibacillus anseongense]|uniref:hypothetical protein n=1 Tax=Paenibacillus anseongense TaxID=2682845 RepID=UPI002DB95349|nr:hypothetical protein [Paenibacillus anseongense]MEC0269698.1 hypothetical protein [Paenibacillus anseongense]